MQTMYPGKVNSPKALTEDIIGASETTIEVSDGSVLPAAPNLAVLGSGENCETILYTVKTENILSGITRGFQGTAQEWPAETPIGRNFTEYDNAAMQANIAEIAARFIASDSVVYVSKQGSDSNAGTRPFSPKLTIGAAMSGLTGGVVRVLDAGTYTEDVTVPNNVMLDAANATIIGAMTVGNGCSVRAAKIMPSANNTTAVTKTGSEISMVDADVWEGRGAAGTLTGTTLAYNSVAGAILYATGRTFNVAEDGWAVKDNASDNGHIHLNADDVYLFGDDSVGAEVQGPNSHIVIIAQHIITPNGITGTTALKSSNSSARIEVTTNEITAEVAALANMGAVAINCPRITGDLTGSGVSVVGRIVGADADLPVFTADDGKLSTKAASAARSALGAADVTAFSAHYTNGIVDGLGLGTPATGSGNVDVADTLNSSLRNAIGAASNANLFINWDWRNPVNQRAATTWSMYSFGIDRWKFQSVSDDGGMTVNAGYVTVSAGSYNEGAYTRVEQNIIETGKTYTVSLLLHDGSVLSAQVVAPAKDGTFVSSSFGSASWNCGMSFNDGAWSVHPALMLGYASASLDIDAVKLELGSVSTLANDPPADYGEQLAKCQRYYLKLKGGYNIYGVAYAYGTNGAYIFIPLPVTMRTVTAIQNWGHIRIVTSDIASGKLITAVNALTNLSNGIAFQGGVSDGLTAHTVYGVADILDDVAFVADL